MSEARRILPGTTYLLTRRCMGRCYLLTPDARGEMTMIIGYCLALAAARHGILVHASVALGNHWHLVVTDVRGTLPVFLRDAHSFIARCVNDVRGRTENVWAVRQPSAVVLLDRGAVWDKLVYCLANATSSGLVASHSAWPGFHTRPGDLIEAPRVYRRPSHYFGARSRRVPKEIALHITKPPCLAHLSDAEYATELTRRLRAKEEELRRQAKHAKRRFRGVAAILSQSPFSRPVGDVPGPRSALNPRVAAEDKETRIAHLGLLADFRRLYARARDLWRQGHRDTLFPPGTYQVVHLHGACVMQAPT
ncbi:MAG: hypothetical protein R3F39_12810 [Myxococcota bacterium]